MPVDFTQNLHDNATIMIFTITETEQQQIDEWLEKLRPELIEHLKKINPHYADIAMDGELYVGAIGGELTYCFTPTSLGTTTIIRENISGNTLDLTDYNSW